MWKTKEVEVKGRKVISMICQNSEPEKSKWSEFGPEDGPCGNWTVVVAETTASLCPECAQRSVNIRMPNP
jgi:hypothetical protein